MAIASIAGSSSPPSAVSAYSADGGEIASSAYLLGAQFTAANAYAFKVVS